MSDPEAARGDDREDRVMVTGGRDYPDRNAVFGVLDALYKQMPNMIVVHGACCKRGRPTELTGADRWAQEWAQERQLPYIGVPARWFMDGNAAGPIRNKAMVDRFRATSAVAFPGGAGTANAVETARKYGLVVWEPFGNSLPQPSAIKRKSVRK